MSRFPQVEWCQGQELIARAAKNLLDPQGRDLAGRVQWWELPGFKGQWPVAVLGEGEPLLLLHGFDSSLLEFRRLAPLLESRFRLYIPDLYGFGFSPRPSSGRYNPGGVIDHLMAVVQRIESASAPNTSPPLGVIGASMGGAVAVELARRLPSRVGRLLLLAPAGLTGRPMPLPPLLDRLGVSFLSLPGVRRGLCRQAFANPDISVGPAEEEIASLHLQVIGWGEALGRFARSGGFAGCGDPLPGQPLKVLWGADDRILRQPQKQAALALLGDRVEELAACGHLPHLDRPEAVAAVC